MAPRWPLPASRAPQGIGLGATGTSYIFLACILGYLTVSKRDQLPPVPA